MTASKSTTLWCDAPECAEWGQEETANINEARGALKLYGWISRRGRDYCPTHAAAIKTGPPRADR